MWQNAQPKIASKISLVKQEGGHTTLVNVVCTIRVHCQASHAVPAIIQAQLVLHALYLPNLQGLQVFKSASCDGVLISLHQST